MTIKAIYLYGSHVYKTANPTSDIDVITIVDEKNKDTEADIKKIVLQKLNINHFIHIDVNIFTETEFLKALENMEISFIECLSQEQNLLYGSKNYNLPKPNLTKLRESISKKSSNSWVKTKKKLIIEHDFNVYIAKKSLWHSLRIIIFGCQIAKNNKITNFLEANYLLDDILDLPNPNNSEEGLLLWQEIVIKYQPIFNQLSSQFKILAPKNN